MLLTLPEVADRLRISVATVRDMARRGELPVIRVSPHRLRVSEDGLAA